MRLAPSLIWPQHYTALRHHGRPHPVHHRPRQQDRPAQGAVYIVLHCTVLYCTVLQVHYATALDWFIVCSFLYCMASLLEFAGVHYFTKVTRDT